MHPDDLESYLTWLSIFYLCIFDIFWIYIEFLTVADPLSSLVKGIYREWAKQEQASLKSCLICCLIYI
jgi:hypothetical protein